MKNLNKTFFLAIILLIAPIIIHSQDKYRIHEDVVKPSHVMEYESILTEMMALVNKHQIKDTHFITLKTINSHYMYISPIAKMADLDKPSFIAELAEKEGKDKISALFNRMDKCYDTELDYILTLDKELSYMPNGITQTPEGENYRQNHIFYFTPANRSIIKEKLQAIKSLYESKNSKIHYRVYKSGFGSNGEYFMVAVAAKNSQDYADKGIENNALLGDAGKKAIGEMYYNTLRYEKLEGEIRPDLSYSSK